MISRYKIHPFATLTATFLLVVGVFITTQVTLLVMAYCFVLIFLITARQIQLHVKMIVFFYIPFFVLLSIINMGILKESRTAHTMVVLLRLVTLTSLCQHILNMPFEELVYILKRLKFHTSVIIIILGSLSIYYDFTLRANRIITSRFARKFLKKRNLLGKLSQIPHIIKPLLSSTFLLAFDRAASWKQRKLIEEIGELQMTYPYKRTEYLPLSLGFSGLIIIWFTLVILKVFL